MSHNIFELISHVSALLSSPSLFSRERRVAIFVETSHDLSKLIPHVSSFLSSSSLTSIGRRVASLLGVEIKIKCMWLGIITNNGTLIPFLGFVMFFKHLSTYRPLSDNSISLSPFAFLKILPK